MAEIYYPGSLALLITLIIMIPKSTSAASFYAQFCSNSSTYAANSSFPTNLKTLFGSLSSNAATNPTGFHTTSAGTKATDGAVYGMFLCRRDLNTSACSDCVATATREQPQRITCPRTKTGIVWYDECMVRYDNQTFAGTLDNSLPLMLTNTANISGDQQAFEVLLGKTMNDLAVQAAFSPAKTGKKYANEEVGFSSLQQLYSMVQCTPDLSAVDCNKCLTNFFIYISKVGRGGRLYGPSCNVRYEIYQFLDTPFNSSSQSTISPSPLPSAPASVNTTTGLVRPGAAPNVVIAVILVAFGSCLILKKAKKYDVVASETGENISMEHSLQYDLGTLKYATNNFSDKNKLGEGGFVVVYKGKLTNGQEIAVKKLSKASSQGVQEFKTEVLVVAKLQHRNLVRLLGFCLAGEEKLLVYEYVANKSLDHFLFDPEKQG